MSNPVMTDMTSVRIAVACVALHALLSRSGLGQRTEMLVRESFEIAKEFLRQAEQE
jgi:hypothetical protein